MSHESDLNALRKELTAIQQQTRRSRRWAIVGFVILVFAMCVSFLYAFVQQVEANNQRDLANVMKYEADKNAEEARMNAAEALRQKGIADETMARLENCLAGKSDGRTF